MDEILFYMSVKKNISEWRVCRCSTSGPSCRRSYCGFIQPHSNLLSMSQSLWSTAKEERDGTKGTGVAPIMHQEWLRPYVWGEEGGVFFSLRAVCLAFGWTVMETHQPMTHTTLHKTSGVSLEFVLRRDGSDTGGGLALVGLNWAESVGQAASNPPTPTLVMPLHKRQTRAHWAKVKTVSVVPCTASDGCTLLRTGTAPRLFTFFF